MPYGTVHEDTLKIAKNAPDNYKLLQPYFQNAGNFHPTEPGEYRIYLIARDEENNNIPVLDKLAGIKSETVYSQSFTVAP